jgi:plastocyanin
MRRIVLGAVVLAAVLTGCSKPSGDVSLTSARRFEPSRLVVKVGDKVTFANNSSEAHTVTAYEDQIPEGADYFASGGATSESAARDNVGDGLLTEGQKFEVSFKKPGTYHYFCIPHEQQGMKGTIVVQR